MENKEIYGRVKKIMIEFLEEDSSGHDAYHAERVFNNALNIHKTEGGNELVIGVSALMHDLLRPWEKKTGKSHFGEEALDIIRKELKPIDLSAEDEDMIINVIAKHDLYDWTEKDNSKSIELQIVQDADRLDAIGAIGIGRTFRFGGAYNNPMYVPGENLDFVGDYKEEVSKPSTIGHFYEKLLKLKDNMNTQTGKNIANERHDFMLQFVDRFLKEWNGDA